MRRTGDLKLIQELNRSIILDEIRHHGPTSRTDISKKHQLSPTTVSSAVHELIQEGLVGESGVGYSSGGRKPRLVQFLPDQQCIIGVSLKKSSIRITEMNLEATVKREISEPIRCIGQPIIERLIALLTNFLSQTSCVENCAGIAVIVQGVVDADEGIIRLNSKLNLVNVPIKKMLEERFRMPVFVDNDTNAFILAEKNFNSLDSYKNMVYVTVGDGVGAGIIVNGDIYRGRSGGSGEFGHTSIDLHGDSCECGSRGCLENYVSWPVIHTRIFSSLSRGTSSKMLDMANGDVTKISLVHYRQALRENDPLAVSINDEVAQYLSVGLVNLVHLFNPEVVILGGELLIENASLFDQVATHLETQTLRTLADGMDVRLTTLGKEFEMLGAASVLLQEKFRFTL
ncbi:ROK family transcriptional regulator [Aureibacillus halotolerans]|uniref:Putative NBD/HSP70 family sugar kinase n=1 Tax=Aureibacillus halotolerans TaxID=1508390 RepID=A0A4R6U4X9_9BACI|nr:ROK family transcriptional regulator [Aureibacillus halotolerans]TDQ41241.1 putative NBD/HSP70 family sugar kinase [Aureibacillus halotolerans]